MKKHLLSINYHGNYFSFSYFAFYLTDKTDPVYELFSLQTYLLVRMCLPLSTRFQTQIHVEKRQYFKIPDALFDEY